MSCKVLVKELLMVRLELEEMVFSVVVRGVL